MDEPFRTDDSFLPSDPNAACRCAECGAWFLAGPGHYCPSPRQADLERDRRHTLIIVLAVVVLLVIA